MRFYIDEISREFGKILGYNLKDEQFVFIDNNPTEEKLERDLCSLEEIREK